MKKLAIFLFTLMLGTTTYAEAASDVVDIERDGTDLATELDVRPDHDRDITDTAIVASAFGSTATVLCTAFDSNGLRLGAARMQIPAKGLRYLRASDITNGVDYIGQVRCTTRKHSVVMSAFLVAPGGITALKTRQRSHLGVSHVQVPVTASY